MQKAPQYLLKAFFKRKKMKAAETLFCFLIANCVSNNSYYLFS